MAKVLHDGSVPVYYMKDGDVAKVTKVSKEMRLKVGDVVFRFGDSLGLLGKPKCDSRPTIIPYCEEKKITSFRVNILSKGALIKL